MLELWSPPGMGRIPLNGRMVAESCRSELSISEHVVLGLNFVPGMVDVSLLQARLDSGESSIHEFQQFCDSHELPFEVNGAVSAAHFVAFVEGQPLAWLHFSEDDLGLEMALSVHRWATSAGYVIRI